MCRRPSAWNILSLILEKHVFLKSCLTSDTPLEDVLDPGSRLIAREVPHLLHAVSRSRRSPTRGTAPPRTSVSSRHPDIAADDWRSRPSPRAVPHVAGRMDHVRLTALRSAGLPSRSSKRSSLLTTTIHCSSSPN